MDTSMISVVNRHAEECKRNAVANEYRRTAYKAKLRRLMRKYGYETWIDVCESIMVWAFYTALLVLVALMGCHVVGWI